MSTIPQELNWVEKRAACNVATVFNQICNGVNADVEAINSVRHLIHDDHFKADTHSSGTTITVGQPNVVPRKRVSIGIVNDRIAAYRDWDEKRWEVSIGLNNEGRCILRDADGRELEQWQFRKMTLEGLFFDEAAS